MIDPYVFERVRLGNGLTVMMNHLPYASSCRFGVNVGAGGRDGKRGVSHLLEHVLSLGKEDELKAGVKIVGGEINLGNTSFESTQFSARVPRGSEEIGLEALADLILNPIFPEELLEAEKQVVAIEILEKMNPKVHKGLWEALKKMFPEDGGFLSWNSLRLSVTGRVEDIQALNMGDLKSHYEAYYFPGNITVFAVGDFKKDKVLNIVDNLFSFSGRVYPLRKNPRREIPLPVIPRKRRMELPDSFCGSPDIFSLSMISGVHFSWPSDFFAVDLFSQAFKENFFRRARALGAVYTPTVQVGRAMDFACCEILCFTDKDVGLMEGEILEALKESAQDKKAFEEMRQQEIARKLAFDESSWRILENSMDEFSEIGKVSPLMEEIKTLESISFEEYNQAASQMIENMAWLVVNKG